MSGQFHFNAGEPNSKMSNIEEVVVDSDTDSWDSGVNQPDLYDTYNNYDKNDPSDDDTLEDEGDENDLGDMSDEDFRKQNDGNDLGMGGNHRKTFPLDDSFYNDRTFDCD